MKKKPGPLRQLARIGAFLLLFSLLFSVVSYGLRDKRYAAAGSSIYHEPKGSIDVVFLGSSHMLNAVAPMQLWRDFGLASNNLAQNGQTLAVSYYALLEALRVQQPRLIVLDVYKIVQESLIDSDASLHYTLDCMEFGVPKLRAITDLLPPDRWGEYLFDIVAYHDRWKELTPQDFQLLDLTEKGAEALFTVEPMPDFRPIPADETAEPPQTAADYLERIVRLCRERQVELLLVAVPYGVPEPDDLHRQQSVNWVTAWAEERGVPFVNLMYRTEELGFDFGTDMADGAHVNWRGMAKVTGWLGAYLTEQYDLPDHRGEAAYASWDLTLDAYEQGLRTELSRLGLES